MTGPVPAPNVPTIRLITSTPRQWFERGRRDLAALLSDHLHCERKAAENALGLVRRYPQDPVFLERLTRLAHEETSHCVQVALLLAERGLAPRQDTPNEYARRLFAFARKQEPDRRLDALLAAGFIEARSHERLGLLARGFAEEGDERLAEFYRALASAEERHAEIFVELAMRYSPADEVAARITEMAQAEAAILADLPQLSRVH